MGLSYQLMPNLLALVIAFIYILSDPMSSHLTFHHSKIITAAWLGQGIERKSGLGL